MRTHVVDPASDAAADPVFTVADLPTDVAGVRRVRIADPVRFGDDPATDRAVLRFLGTCGSELVGVDWRLAGPLPWPVRTVVHLPPPTDATAEAGRLWRRDHRFGLCTYRTGPGFIRILDLRPGGRRLRAVLDGPLVSAFNALVSGETEELLDDLIANDLALRIGDGHHIVPIRLHRWPVPHPDQ